MTVISTLRFPEEFPAFLGEDRMRALLELCARKKVTPLPCREPASLVLPRDESSAALFDLPLLERLHLELGYLPGPCDVVIHDGKVLENCERFLPLLNGVHTLVGMAPLSTFQVSLQTFLDFREGRRTDDLPFSVSGFGVPGSFQHHRAELRQSAERHDTIAQGLAFVRGMLGGSLCPRWSTFEDHLMTSLEELFMNAIWDASPARAQVDRREPVILPAEEAVTLDIWCDAHYVMASVTDRIGSLKLGGLLNLKKFCIGPKRVRILNESGPGAGIGLYMAAQRSLALAFELDPGVSHRASVFFEAPGFGSRSRERAPSVIFLDRSSVCANGSGECVPG